MKSEQHKIYVQSSYFVFTPRVGTGLLCNREICPKQANISAATPYAYSLNIQQITNLKIISHEEVGGHLLKL